MGSLPSKGLSKCRYIAYTKMVLKQLQLQKQTDNNNKLCTKHIFLSIQVNRIIKNRAHSV